MATTASIKYLRIAPRKMRLIADLIRGKSAGDARNLLRFTIKKGAKDFLSLLESAISSAKGRMIDESALYIKKLTVDEGPKLKRWMPRARGQATPLQRKTSHINLVLEEIEGPKPRPTIAGAPEKKSVETKEKIVKINKPKFKQAQEAPRMKTGAVSKKIFKRQVF